MKMSIKYLIVMAVGLSIFIPYTIFKDKNPSSNNQIIEEIEHEKEEIKKDEPQVKETKKEEPQIEIDDLINDEDYTIIEPNDYTINIFDTLKPIIYLHDIENIDDFYDNDIETIIGYNIKTEDIKDVKQEGKDNYGYINKALFDKQIDNIFGPNSDIISKRFDKMVKDPYVKPTLSFKNADYEFRNGTILKETDNRFYFLFYKGTTTWAVPTFNNVPIKLVEIRIINDYLLLVSKAVYTTCYKKNETDDYATVSVYMDFGCERKIDEFQVSTHEEKYELDINKYLDNANNIYLVLKSDNKGNYYFYKSGRALK